MESIISSLDNIILIALAVIGGLRLIADGLEKIAKATYWTDKDDAAVAKLKSVLEKVTSLLRKFGLDPKA